MWQHISNIPSFITSKYHRFCAGGITGLLHTHDNQAVVRAALDKNRLTVILTGKATTDLTKADDEGSVKNETPADHGREVKAPAIDNDLMQKRIDRIYSLEQLCQVLSMTGFSKTAETAPSQTVKVDKSNIDQARILAIDSQTSLEERILALVFLDSIGQKIDTEISQINLPIPDNYPRAKLDATTFYLPELIAIKKLIDQHPELKLDVLDKDICIAIVDNCKSLKDIPEEIRNSVAHNNLEAPDSLKALIDAFPQGLYLDTLKGDLAFFHAKTIQSRQTPQAAIDWYLHAARTGSKSALLEVGRLLNNDSLQAEYQRLSAQESLKKAAKSGNGEAALALADYYFKKSNSRRDVLHTQKYYELAAKHGNEDTRTTALTNLSVHYWAIRNIDDGQQAYQDFANLNSPREVWQFKIAVANILSNAERLQQIKNLELLRQIDLLKDAPKAVVDRVHIPVAHALAANADALFKDRISALAFLHSAKENVQNTIDLIKETEFDNLERQDFIEILRLIKQHPELELNTLSDRICAIFMKKEPRKVRINFTRVPNDVMDLIVAYTIKNRILFPNAEHRRSVKKYNSSNEQNGQLEGTKLAEGINLSKDGMSFDLTKIADKNIRKEAIIILLHKAKQKGEQAEKARQALNDAVEQNPSLEKEIKSIEGTL